jgi:hypothetical protein
MLLLLLWQQQLPAAIASAPGDKVDAENALDVAMGLLENLALDEGLGVNGSPAGAAAGSIREPGDLIYPLSTLAEEVQNTARPDYQLAEKLYRTATVAAGVAVIPTPPCIFHY